jgi:hypothetical protein
MLSINFNFGGARDLLRRDVEARFFDADGEEACRQMIVQGMKKYQSCQRVMSAIGHTTLSIMCNKGVGNWYDDETNTVWFDRSHPLLPHLVSNGVDYTIPALVCLFHELGHAKQFYENRIWYRSAASQTDEMGVCYMIEYDNLHRHEDPLLREMGLPTRPRYESFVSEAQARQMVQGA